MLVKTGSALNTLQIYPNPAHDRVSILLSSDQERDCALNLYDELGHLLDRKQVHCIKGMNRIEWNISRLAAGVYNLECKNIDVKNARILKN